MRKVYDVTTGRFRWVNDDGSPLDARNDPMGVNPGLGSLPGRGMAREAEMLARLPDAQLAGYSGPSVVNPQQMRGARPNDPDPVPPQTYRPLAGAKQNNRGNTKVVSLPATVATSVVEVPSIVETPKNSGDDAESLIVVCGYKVVNGVVSTPPSLDITGIVEFGIGGASFEAEFDWRNGMVFSLPASFIRVSAQISYENLVSPVEVALDVGLAYGSTPASAAANLKRSFRGSLLAPADTLQGIIPPFATGVTVALGSIVNPLATSCKLTLSGGGGTGPAADYFITNSTNAANQNDGQFTIPKGMTDFVLTNQGISTVKAQVVFTIGL